MNAKLIYTALLFSSLLLSCSHAVKDKQTFDIQLANIERKEPPPQDHSNKKQKIPVGSLSQYPTDSVAKQFPLQPAALVDWDKKIIKNAVLKFEVKDFKNYNNSLHSTIKQFGGYIAQEQQNLTDEKSESVIVIKVPVEQFESMMNQLAGNDNKILERKITTEDVTGEVVDTKSRLEARKGMRLKYLEFLKQSKNMEEVLQVQNEINSIQEEIESAAGRVEFLSHQSAYSTINLTFYQPINGYKPVDGTPSFFTRVSTSFKTGSDWVIDLVIGLISIWPLLLVTLGIYIGWKKLKPQKIVIQNS